MGIKFIVVTAISAFMFYMLFKEIELWIVETTCRELINCLGE